MSAFWRGFALASSLMVAFVAGWVLRTPPAALDAVKRELNDTPPPMATAAADPALALPPAIDNANPVQQVQFDPADPTMQQIKAGLGINTGSLLDPKDSVPGVLVGLPGAEKPPEPALGPAPRPEPPQPMIHLPPVGIGVDATVPAPRTEKSMTYVNRRDIALAFDVTKTGLTEIVATELWTKRRDHGWAKTDEMEGCKSPFRTRLGSDGEYGFKLVFVSKSGKRSAAPTHGTPADVEVVLDTTPPPVEISRPTNHPTLPTTVILNWRATGNDVERTEALEFSADGVTWLPVLQVNGQMKNWQMTCEWVLPPGVTDQVHLRASVRDRAGNIGKAETPAPVSIDFVAPEGKVIGLVEEMPEAGPMPREVSFSRGS